MKSMILVAATLASAMVLASTPGHALTFDFFFTNTTGITPGTVIGEIDGLMDNATGPATAVIINSAPSVFNLATPFSVPTTAAPINSFTVSAGVIDAGHRVSFKTFHALHWLHADCSFS